MLRKLWNALLADPAMAAYAFNGAVTAWVAFGFRASPGQTAAVATIGTAIASILTAFAARPVRVQTITAALATIAAAASTFGLHLSSAEIGAGVPIATLLLSLALRTALTPLVTIRQAQPHAPEHAAPRL